MVPFGSLSRSLWLPLRLLFWLPLAPFSYCRNVYGSLWLLRRSPLPFICALGIERIRIALFQLCLNSSGCVWGAFWVPKMVHKWIPRHPSQIQNEVSDPNVDFGEKDWIFSSQRAILRSLSQKETGSAPSSRVSCQILKSTSAIAKHLLAHWLRSLE